MSKTKTTVGGVLFMTAIVGMALGRSDGGSSPESEPNAAGVSSGVEFADYYTVQPGDGLYNAAEACTKTPEDFQQVGAVLIDYYGLDYTLPDPQLGVPAVMGVEVDCPNPGDQLPASG